MKKKQKKKKKKKNRNENIHEDENPSGSKVPVAGIIIGLLIAFAIIGGVCYYRHRASSYNQIVRRSDDFLTRMGDHGKVYRGKQRATNFWTWPEVFQWNAEKTQTFKKSIVEMFEGTRPMLHYDHLKLLEEFIVIKREHGTNAERDLYEDMTVVKLVTRLLTKRPLAFYGARDHHVLRFDAATAALCKMTESRNLDYGIELTASGVYKFKSQKDPKGAPLNPFDTLQHHPEFLKEYISYDEMALSSNINISTPTYAVNDGPRFNGRMSPQGDETESEYNSGWQYALRCVDDNELKVGNKILWYSKNSRRKFSRNEDWSVAIINKVYHKSIMIELVKDTITGQHLKKGKRVENLETRENGVITGGDTKNWYVTVVGVGGNITKHVNPNSLRALKDEFLVDLKDKAQWPIRKRDYRSDPTRRKEQNGVQDFIYVAQIGCRYEREDKMEWGYGNIIPNSKLENKNGTLVLKPVDLAQQNPEKEKDLLKRVFWDSFKEPGAVGNATRRQYIRQNKDGQDTNYRRHSIFIQEYYRKRVRRDAEKLINEAHRNAKAKLKKRT